MKLTDYTGWLVSTIRDEETTATELLRALREQSSHFDPDAAPTDTALGPDILRAKSGPRGGLDADPFRAAFVLLAVALGGKRSDIGMRVWRTWHIGQEGSITAGWGDDCKPTFKVCPITHEHLFGDALKVVLADEDLARNIEKVRLSDDHFAEIHHSNGTISRFQDTLKRDAPPLIRVAEIDSLVIASIGSLLKRY